MEVYSHTISPEKLKDSTGNEFQIDAVVRDNRNHPVILLDPKYIRYTKHNRDKGSWLCVAHYNLRKTYPSIRKCIAVLAGNWSRTSIEMITSFGIETLEIPFQHMAEVIRAYGVEFDWAERDSETPKTSFEAYLALNPTQKEEMVECLTQPVRKRLEDSVIEVLEATVSEQRICGVEVLLKTESNQMLLREYESVPDALKGMVQFTSDRRDVGVFLERGNE